MYGLEKEKEVINWESRIYPIAHRMQKGDWAVLPSKINRTIHIGEIKGDYVYDESLGSPYYYYRKVKWFAQDIPRDRFDQDSLYSFGAFMTICAIHRNNAEERIKEMAQNDWQVKNKSLTQVIEGSDDSKVEVDLEEYIFDTIAEYIIRKFKGHRIEMLIEKILKAKGFTTYRNPEGLIMGLIF